MTEQKCRELIKSDLRDITVQCGVILEEMDEFEFVAIDWQLDRVIRTLETAKKRLKDCENY